jgi:[ribosomal protein S5]-alanine N-acetyltransferase
MKLVGHKIYLRFLKDTDVGSLTEMHRRNREFWQRYTPDRTEEFYTEEYQLNRIQTCLAKMERDEQYTFGIFLVGTDELIGIIELTEVVRGPLQTCWLGYYVDQSHNGHGYTTEAVRLVVDYAFEVLKLHRIEAGVMPHNIGSIRVLEKAGFHKEGLSKKNVKINGRWEDHLHFAIVNPNDSE